MAGNRDVCDVWLWDGAVEYEGMVVRVSDAEFTARMRRARRKSEGTTTLLGRRVPGTSLDLHRHFAGKQFVARFAGRGESELFGAEVESVQSTGDSDFDYLLSGRFGPLDPEQREGLKSLAFDAASAGIQRRVG